MITYYDGDAYSGSVFAVGCVGLTLLAIMSKDDSSLKTIYECEKAVKGAIDIYNSLTSDNNKKNK